MDVRLGRHLRIWDRIFGWKRRNEAADTLRHVHQALRPGNIVLDVGCGMGYALEVLAEDYGMIAVGCDVVPTSTRSLRRFCRFDGWTLPFANESVDIAMLIFVLHHAKDPAALLHEAARVARNAVLVVEDTPRNLLDQSWGKFHIHSFNRRHKIPWSGEIRTEDGWLDLFADCGMQVTAAERLGRFERLPPVSRTAFLLDPHATRHRRLAAS